MVWLNYRNAYERWDEQRRALNSEILEATKSVISQTTPLVMSSASSVGGAIGGGGGGSSLFLQLTVNDIGVCIPLTPSYAVSKHLYVIYLPYIREIFLLCKAERILPI